MYRANTKAMPKLTTPENTVVAKEMDDPRTREPRLLRNSVSLSGSALRENESSPRGRDSQGKRSGRAERNAWHCVRKSGICAPMRCAVAPSCGTTTKVTPVSTPATASRVKSRAAGRRNRPFSPARCRSPSRARMGMFSKKANPPPSRKGNTYPASSPAARPMAPRLLSSPQYRAAAPRTSGTVPRGSGSDVCFTAKTSFRRENHQL